MSAAAAPAVRAVAGSAAAAANAVRAAKTGTAACHLSLLAQFMTPSFPRGTATAGTGKESAYPLPIREGTPVDVSKARNAFKIRQGPTAAPLT